MKAEEREPMLEMVDELLSQDMRFAKGPLRGELAGDFMTRVHAAALEIVRSGKDPKDSVPGEWAGMQERK